MTFVAMKRWFVAMKKLFVATKRWFVRAKKLDIAQQLPCFFFSTISSSLCSVFTKNLQNTLKRGIRPFFSDNIVNFELKLYKTREKHTENVNKILTYQTPPNLVFFLSSSKDIDVILLSINNSSKKNGVLKEINNYESFYLRGEK